MITYKEGNIFDTRVQVIVNPINCKGAMGAGLALQFKKREPEMYQKYKILCNQGLIAIGKLWICKSKDNTTSYNKILNFPTKDDWRNPAKEEHLHLGLKKFLETYKDKGIVSIAFPILGSGHGGIDPKKSLEIMQYYLSQCNNIEIEIWKYSKKI